jgi:adenylylsulfate kinase
VPGLQDPYEAPVHPDVAIDATTLSANDAARKVLDVLKEKFKQQYS